MLSGDFRPIVSSANISSFQLDISVWQQFFDYFGGVLSYVIQYLPIIILGTYDSKSPAELSQTISNNAFVYIYLINSFTTVTDMAINVGQMAGIFQRYEINND